MSWVSPRRSTTHRPIGLACGAALISSIPFAQATPFPGDSSTPVSAARHCLPPIGRFDLEEIQRLGRDERCFVLHAALRARHDTNPLVLLNVGTDTLISVLRQLRAGG